MGDRWRPTTGDEWFRVTDKRLDILERRTPGGNAGAASAYVYEFPRRVPGAYVTYVDNITGDDSWAYPTAYMRNGFVQLSGLIALSTNVSEAVLFTLPPGWRPDSGMIFPVSNTDITRGLTVWPDGRVTVRLGLTTSGFVSLDRIIFPVAGRAAWTNIDPAGTAGSTHVFQNGWTDRGEAQWGRVRYWEDEYGMVWFSGLANPGTTTSNTVMFTLPTSMATTIGQQHVSTIGGEALTAVSSSTSTSTAAILTKQPTASGWVSLSGVTMLTNRSLTLNTWRQGGVDFLPSSGWTNLAGFPAMRHTVRDDGLAFTSGMVTAGTMGGKMFTLLDQARYDRGRVFTTLSADAYGRFDLLGWRGQPDGSRAGWVIPASGSNGWISLDGLKWVTL